jgi:hypothetical protein
MCLTPALSLHKPGACYSLVDFMFAASAMQSSSAVSSRGVGTAGVFTQGYRVQR